MMSDPNAGSIFAEVLGENNAQEVFQKLEALENERHRLISRWVWELIQNARGTAGSQAELRLRLEYLNGSLVFRHNGAHFKEKEVAHLVLHGSTKSSVADIGRFGTGFITTHLLSRRVRIRGSLESGKSFDFWLDRSGKDPVSLQSQMEQSWANFETSLEQAVIPVDAPYTTEFTYPISEAVTEAIDAGIESLLAAAPYLFAFNSMLRLLEIIRVSGSSGFEVEPGSPAKEMENGVRHFRLRTAGESLAVAIRSVGDVSAAAILSGPDDALVMTPTGKVPRLFVAFPLNGMERFPFPAAVNSESFVPRSERDGIHLAVGISDANKTNMRLFVEGCSRIVELYSDAARRGWKGLAASLLITGDVNVTGVDSEWLRQNLTDHLIERLRTVPLVLTIDGQTICPSESWVPMPLGNCPARNVWDLSQHLATARAKLPVEAEFETWRDVEISWKRFSAPKEPRLREWWSIVELTAFVASFRTVSALSKSLVGVTDPFAWLDNFYTCILESGQSALFQTQTIVPNQLGEFRTISGVMRDAGIQEDLKKVADAFGIKLRDQLVDTRIANNNAFKSVAQKSEDHVVSELLDHLKKHLAAQLDEQLFLPNVALFRALLLRGRFDKLEGFPAGSLLRTQERRAVIKIRAKAPSAQRPLAPPSLWPDTAKPFVEVFAEAVILAQEYASDEDHSLWEQLVNQGFVHRDPVYSVEKHVDHFLPDEPLSEDEKSITSENLVTQSDVAWTSSDNFSIFERSRSSSNRSLALLAFFLNHALVVDTRALVISTAKCDNGVTHKYFGGAWLVPLRTRRWVFVETKKYDSPSIVSFTALLGNQPKILERLREPMIAALFTAIGVTPSDLFLRTIAATDADRMTLIHSIATIAEACGNDPQRVEAVADALHRDDAVIQFIEERKADRARVERNQALGRLVEETFAEVMGESLKVKRTGPGHDYKLLAQGQDDGGVIKIESNTRCVFVEIKATANTAVRMSELQASEAVSNSACYVLCVVPGASASLTPDDFKAQARFVFAIGDLLKPAWSSYTNYNSAYEQTRTGTSVAVEVGDHEVKFRVEEAAWQSASSYDAAVSRMMAILEPKPIQTPIT